MDETAPLGNKGTLSNQPQQAQSQKSAQETLSPPPPYKAPPPPTPPPPQETETPPVSENVPESFTVETPKSKLWIYILLTIFFLAILIGGSVFFFWKQKNDLKDLTQVEISKIKSLQTTYNQIITVIRETPEEKSSTTQNQLLGAKTSLEETGLEGTETESIESAQEKVLGLEDSPEMKQLRELGELYREGKKTANEIDSNGFNIGLKIYSFPFNFFFSKNKPLIDKTEAYAEEATNFLDYLDKENSISIRAITVGFEIGIAFEEAILRGADDLSVENYEDKIKELERLINDYRRIDTSKLTEDLREEHRKEAARANNEIEVFYELLNGFRDKDIEALERGLQSLMLDIVTTSETGLVETVTFWQKNPTVRGIEGLEEDWEELQAEINKFPI